MIVYTGSLEDSHEFVQFLRRETAKLRALRKLIITREAEKGKTTTVEGEYSIGESTFSITIKLMSKDPKAASGIGMAGVKIKKLTDTEFEAGIKLIRVK